MAESISVQMDKLMEAYSDKVQSAWEVSLNRVTRESVQRLRNTSPRKTGSYAKGWALKRVKSMGSTRLVSIIVHNRTDYQLTHLLENGHAIVNKKGSYGRAPAHKHIAPVAEWAQNDLPLEIERELR